MVFMSMRDHDVINRIHDLGIDRPWEQVPLVAVSGTMKPGIQRYPRIAGIDHDTGMTDVFNLHGMEIVYHNTNQTRYDPEISCNGFKKVTLKLTKAAVTYGTPAGNNEGKTVMAVKYCPG